MPVVNGTLTDFGLDPLTVNSPVLLFRASSTGIAGLNLLSARKAVEAVPAANGYFEVDLVSTSILAPETTHYTVEIRYRETGTGLMVSEKLPWKLLVPPEGGTLGDLLRVPANPALVWTGTEPPINPSPGTWWLDPDTGDLSEMTQDGTTWDYKANLRGPAGYNATGAAEDDAAVALFILSAAGTTATRTALQEHYGRGISVKTRGAVGDGVADDAPKFAAAQAAAAARGGVMYVPAGTYRFAAPVAAMSGVHWVGEPGAKIIANTPIGAAVNNGGANVIGWGCSGIEFIGGALEEGIYPRRVRTVSPSMMGAITLTGDLFNEGVNPVIRDITITDCTFRNTEGLPVFLRGVRGRSILTGNKIINCLDTGFVYCESVAFINNYVDKSADNGVSVSRECESVVVANNVILNSCNYGVWVSGFVGNGVSAAGPDVFTVLGNVVRNSGMGGIALRDAPRYGTVTGNIIDHMVQGPTDIPDGNYGWGISITGYIDDLGVTHYADQINVAGNTFRDCARGGVGLRGARDIRVSDNLFIDIGSATMHDGTPIAANSVTHNGGVINTDPNPMLRIAVIDNTFTDTRPAPVMNYAVVPGISLTENYIGEGNRVYRARQPHIEHSTLGNGGYFRALDTAGSPRRLMGLTTANNTRFLLPATAGIWQGYSADELTELWRITSSGRAQFNGGVTTKHTAAAAAPTYVTNGQIELWHDTASGNSYLIANVNGVIKKTLLT